MITRITPHKSKLRISSDSVWPLRSATGQTFAEKQKDTLKGKTVTLNDHVIAAIRSLEAANDIRAAHAHLPYREQPQVHDELLIQLLEAMIAFDEEPQGTIEELTREDEQYMNRFPLPDDAEWDYAVAIGAA
jgi:hypothetical protein